ncbi:MAG: ABC transporter substrate-binding protein [Deltaproteobacteria bacterium]|nr:MAG: ABC transporter substrate-binding protein [Deltaproteobacteria bacterium]
MIFITVLSGLAFIFSSTGDAWSQRNLPTVRIGIEAPAGTNSHYYVSKQLGLFQKHGINIELISFPGGTVGLQALFAGDIQFATSDGVAGLSANLRGANLYFIAGMINTFPFSILSRPEIRTPQELRGKKIVISRYGSSSDTAVRAAVEKYDLKPDKDVIILQGGGQSERFAALKAGAVDAAIVSPPLNLAGRKMGFNEVIDLSESGVAYSHQQIVAIKDYLDRNPDTVLRTLRALIEGLAAWKDPAKKSLVMGHVAKYLRLDPEKNKDQIEETYRYYSKTFPTKPYSTAEGLEFTAQILKKNRPEAKDLQAKDFLNNRFVAELEKEGFLAKVFGGK